MLNYDNPPRLITAMVTPMREDGVVDFDKVNYLAKLLARTGSDGIVLSGSTGESPTLSHNEKLDLFYEVIEAVGDKTAIIAGTGNYNTRESIMLSIDAENAGVDALLLVVPYYNRPQQEGLYQHFKAIAESVDIPCILYNVPSRTATNMTAETTIRLSKIPNIVGIKEASSDMEQIQKIINNTPDNFYVWSGNDDDTHKIMLFGGYGVVSVASHLVGLQLRSMIEACIHENFDEASATHEQLLDLFNILFIEPNPVPVKSALRIAGIDVGDPRLPLVPMSPENEEKLRAVLAKHTMDISTFIDDL
jgi:4-hydroxy-tetrahydrodipicolinate synthase